MTETPVALFVKFPLSVADFNQFWKVKGKVPLWGRSALQPYRLIVL
jgi:hypothetical protein